MDKDWRAPRAMGVRHAAHRVAVRRRRDKRRRALPLSSAARRRSEI